MDRRRTLMPFAALSVALALGCQGGGQKGKGSSGGSPAVTQSFDAEEFSCKKKSQKKQGARLQGDDVPTWDGAVEDFIKAKCVACHAAGGTPPDLSTYEGVADTAVDSLETMELTGAGRMPPAGGLTEDEIATFRAWIDGGTPESASGDDAADGGAGGDDEADEDSGDDDSGDAGESEGDSEGDSEYDDTLCPNAARAGDEAAAAGGDAAGDSASGTKPEGGSGDRVVSYTQDIAPVLAAYCVSCHVAGKQVPALDTYAAAQAAGARIVARSGAGTMPPGGAGIPQPERDLIAAWAAGSFRENAN